MVLFFGGADVGGATVIWNNDRVFCAMMIS